MQTYSYSGTEKTVINRGESDPIIVGDELIMVFNGRNITTNNLSRVFIILDKRKKAKSREICIALLQIKIDQF